uniref:Salt-induced SI2 protein n=1 Tax=Mesembryanthemum crystallinum TaxID=3544 RepID=Q9SWF0_MESCR|nr:salt-induced SI2 protein [Mesembryanthemum crystallinum]
MDHIISKGYCNIAASESSSIDHHHVIKSGRDLRPQNCERRSPSISRWFRSNEDRLEETGRKQFDDSLKQVMFLNCWGQV